MTGLAPAARRLDDLTLAETIDHNSIQIVPLRVAQRAPTLEVDRLVSNRIRAVDRGRITSQELSSEIVQGLVEIIVRVRGMAADVPAQGPASRISVMSIGPVAIIDPVREMAADDLVLVPADRISVMSIARAAIIDQDRGMVAVVLVRVLAAPMSDTSIVPEVVIDQDKGMVQEITMIMAAVPAGQVATDLEIAREIGRGPEIGQPMS